MFRGSIEARTEIDTPTRGIVDLTNWCCPMMYIRFN